MKKILLLFTSFLFTSNLTLFGADSFGAQADKAQLPFLKHLHIDRLPLDKSSKEDLNKLITELYTQAGYSSEETWLPSYFRIDLLTAINGFLKTKQNGNEKIEKMMKQYQKKAKDYQQAPFYQRLSVPEDYQKEVESLFRVARTGINAPALSPEQKITVLTPLIEMINQDDALSKTDYPNYLADLLKDAEQKLKDKQEELAQKKAAEEAARLKKEEAARLQAQKQEAARLQQEAADREAQEAADREAEKEKRKWANVFAPTPGVKSQQELQKESKERARQKLEEERAQQQAEKDRLEKAAYLESLAKQYKALRPSAREELKGTMVDPKDKIFFERLDAQLALEARERSLMKEHNKLEQLKREIIEQERLALLEHYRANLGSFIFHCSEYIKNNPELTDQAKQSLENLIALLEGKRAASGQLTKADFLAMEQNSLLAEVTSVMEEFPEFKLAIKSHFDTANDMWNSILDGYKNPNSVGFNEVSN